MGLSHAWLSPSHLRAASTPEIGRELIASTRFDRGLDPPLTLGMARVVLRPGAATWASIPGGVRMISVESGMLGVAVGASASDPLTTADLTVAAEPPKSDDELLVPAGTTMTFGARGIASVRNPGSRSAVLLDTVVFREEPPRPLARAFTTTNGLSFQLLASASADASPVGALIVALEALRLPAWADLPQDLSAGLTLMYVEAGTVDLAAQEGKVSSARAAASAPYAVPGALQAITAPETRGVTAGGVIFLEVGAAARVRNAGERTAELLVLKVRETF
jgi:hypothetical protein